MATVPGSASVLVSSPVQIASDGAATTRAVPNADDGIDDGISIWWWAFGYFAAYAPYSALTKALSSGAVGTAVSGVVVLPLSVLASTVGMGVFLLLTGWWRAASRITIAGHAVPAPTRLTLISGACTAAILVTTTLAYTFDGISIVFAMLLMRGGVLVIAPIVDVMSGRRLQTRSKLALPLTVLALIIAWAERGGFDLPAVAAVDIGIYLAAYFVRLRLMSGQAKRRLDADNRRFFVEEQLVAAPLSLVLIAGWAALGAGSVSEDLVHGFVGLPLTTAALVVVVGVLSQLTGVFGGLILLDHRENTFCVPVNRASSVLAGVVATVVLWSIGGGAAPSPWELGAAALLVAAIAVLSVPSRR